jgi:GDSL-like Lipase/Acylhydrolase family
VNLVRRRSMKWGLAILGGTTLFAWPIASALHRDRARARRGRRFVQRLRQPAARVLVVGDSSALGVGVTTQWQSVAARLAAAHPSWTIGNLAGDRNRTADVAHMLGRMVQRLGRHGTGPYYDAVVIQIGSIDALRFTREGPLSVSLVLALAAAGELARHVVLVTGANLAPAFLYPPWSWLIGWRGRRVRDLFGAIAWEAGVEYIDLYRPAVDRTADVIRRSANDGLHKADADNAAWFQPIDIALTARVS